MVYKLDRVAPLTGDPPPSNSTTMHIRLVLQDTNVCIDLNRHSAQYIKTAFTVEHMTVFLIIQDLECGK